MFFIIYQITNLVNNKIYIGKHKTADLNDDYFGSGKVLKRAISKYGMNNFKKEILRICQSETEMNQIESKLVNEEFLKRKDVYNLRLGGTGGFDYINKLPQKSETSRRGANAINQSGAGIIGARKSGALNAKAWKEGKRTNPLEKVLCDFSWDTTKHRNALELAKRPEARAKRKKTLEAIKHQQGERNSQYGKIWIVNETLRINKSIKKEDLASYEVEGWKKGRKFWSG